MAYVAVKVDPGSTTPIAFRTGADGNNMQVVSLDVGSGGNQTPLIVGQAAMVASLPVVIASDQTAVKVDGSAVTQPVSGTVTANIGSSGSLALDATLTGGTQKAIVRGGAKGTTTATDVTSTASGVNHQPLDVAIYDGAGNQLGVSTAPLQVSLANTGANATAVKVDGSAVTQPVSGTVTANAGTNLNTSLLALETGGNLAILAGAVTSTKVQGNLAQVGGSTISTAATGVQKVGIVGNAGAALDSTVAPGTAPTNAVASAGVYNSSAPAPTSGQAMANQFDQAGNQRVFPGAASLALSAWNSATSLNATQNIYTNAGCAAVAVQLVQTTTLTAGAVTFEVTFDGTNWVTVSSDAVIDPTSTLLATIALPYTVQASTNKPFIILCKGAQGLRVKLSTQITGTGTVTPNYTLLGYQPLQQVNVLNNVNIAANANPLTTRTIAPATGGGLAKDIQFGVVTHISRASAANPVSLHAMNLNAALRYFQLFNRSGALAGGETPDFCFPVPAGSATVPGQIFVGLDFFYHSGFAFATGLVWGFSTTQATYTAATAADHMATVMFA